MERSQLEVWSLELANFFIKNHGYQLVTLNQETSEIWLINAKHSVFPVLMISMLPFDEIDVEDIAKHREALGMLVRIEPKGINFSVNPNSTVHDENNIVVGLGTVSNAAILNVYKDLDRVLKKSSNLNQAKNRALGAIRKNMKTLNKVNLLKTTKVTTAFSMVAAFMFGVTIMLVSLLEVTNNVGLVMLGAYYKPFIVKAHEWWRLVTPMFLHGDIFHLLFNIIALRNVGRILEKEIGGWRYAATLVIGVIFGSVFLFVRDDTAIAVGMSAGIYALMGYLVVFLYEYDLLKNQRILSSVISTILINVLISAMPNVSFTAHLGGLYAGLFLGFIFSKREDWAYLRKGSAVIFGISVGLLVSMMIQKMDVGGGTLLDVEVFKTWYEFGFKDYANRIARLVIGVN